jgi:hypothetical protein
MSAGTPARRRATRRITTSLLVALGLLLAFASAASAAVTWKLSSRANTAVAPGRQLTYHIGIENGGGELDFAFGLIELDVTLPAGLRGVSSFDPDGLWTCPTIAGATSFTCSRTGGFVMPGLPGRRFIEIAVEADPAAGGVLTSAFEISGGGAPQPTTTVDPTRVESGPPAFGVDAFDGGVDADAAGTPYTQAGGHPHAIWTTIDFATADTPTADPPDNSNWPVEAPRDLFVDLPPGLVGDPTSLDQCTLPELAATTCPITSQVGIVVPHFDNGNTFRTQFVFNMVPPPNVPARFGFEVLRNVVVLDATVRSGGDYGLTVGARNLSQALALTGSRVVFWGTPYDSAHDLERPCSAPGRPCSIQAQPKPFLRLPTSCTPDGVGLPTNLHTASWANPGTLTPDGRPNLSDPAWASASFVSHDPPGYPFVPGPAWGPPQGPTGCDELPFAPTLTATPASPARAGAPIGFSFDLTLPQTNDQDLLATSDLKKTVVTLPEGLRVSPSSSIGLAGCSQQQIALDSGLDPTCPDASKIGSMQIDTPLLRDPLTGSIYLAAPGDNKFGTLLALYLVARGPGVVVKLPGRIDADPGTGRLTTTFDDNPQLPFSRLHLEFTDGPRSPLVSPPRCGTYTTRALMTSWSGRTVESESSFTLSQAADGSPCAPLGFTPGFKAGVENPAAGASSSFVLQFGRDDDDQELSAITVDMPDGLLGHIADTVLCEDGAANAGACGDGSRIGRVVVGAGAGSSPYYISNGRVHITGPYKGAPFGLSIVVPAVAGPFDLGNVVVRSALFVDKHDATLTVVSDPLPAILQGIPLQVRDVRVHIDREGFMVNPTSCSEKRIDGVVRSTAGAQANVGSRFQMGGCASLPLRPRMILRVGGRRRTQRGRTTPLVATLRQTAGQSNLKAVEVTLPATINARLAVINDACTRAEFEAGDCEDARAGSATAVTPLLRDPLRGSAYFVRNGNPLPDLFVALRGQVDFDLIGKITIPRSKFLRTTFDKVPDVPISMFSLRLAGGRRGSVGNAVNLCSKHGKRGIARVVFSGQNGARELSRQRLRIAGCRTARRRAAARPRAGAERALAGDRGPRAER